LSSFLLFLLPPLLSNSDQQVAMSAPPKLNFAEDFMLSGAAAVISKTASAPIERVKLLIQNQDEMLKTGRLTTPYKGVMDCFTRVMNEEGLVYFWRGNLANCIRYFPTQALNFSFKPRFKQLLGRPKSEGYWPFFFGNIASGGCAGASSLLFVYSLDFARTRLANDAKSAKKGGERQFNGLVDVYKKIFASDGVAGLYRGFVISAVGIFVYRGFYFGLYDSLQMFIPVGFNNFFGNFVLGWGVTTTAGLASYPIDTIRRRMMMTSGEGTKYRNSLHAAGVILKNEGVSSFFKGAGANIMRGIAGAGVLAGFDLFKKSYIEMRYGV